MKTIYYGRYLSDLGPLWLGLFEEELCFLSLQSPKELESWAKKLGYHLKPISQFPNALTTQLTQYFNGQLKTFDYPLGLLDGSPFEQQVWKTLATIPWGETRSYAWVAKKIGAPKAYRAVGRANGKNRIPIVIPCHRVINSNGKLGGYSGGIGIKKKLLRIENTL